MVSLLFVQELMLEGSKELKAYFKIIKTISRSKEYISAGADMIFPEGLNSIEEFKFT